MAKQSKLQWDDFKPKSAKFYIRLKDSLTQKDENGKPRRYLVADFTITTSTGKIVEVEDRCFTTTAELERAIRYRLEEPGIE